MADSKDKAFREKVSNIIKRQSYSSGKGSINLDNLPRELLQEICELLVKHNRVVRIENLLIKFVKHTKAPGIECESEKSKVDVFVISQKINEICSDILYEQNTFQFVFRKRSQESFRSISEGNRRKIRKLRLIAYTDGFYTDQAVGPDTALWASVLQGLTLLQIVDKVSAATKDPVFQIKDHFDREKKFWLSNLELYVKCIGEHLSNETRVEVDDGRGLNSTNWIFGKYLPHGFHKVELSLHDVYPAEIDYEIEDLTMSF